jgi:SOS-response transcriptional repressor LexA
VSALIANLEAEGLIEVRRTAKGRIKTPSIRLAGMRRTRSVPMLGRISAGRPILASGDDLMEFVSLPADRARGAEVYMLEVKGESMIGAGILDGVRLELRDGF